MKTCSKCKLEKPASDFVTMKKSKDGLSCYCKPCWCLYQKNRYETSKLCLKELVERKKCTICKQEKSKEDFCRNITSSDGLHYRCKDCEYAARGHKTRLKPPVLNLTEIQKAYLAGLIDGEGYIGLAKPKRKTGPYKGSHYIYARMAIAMTTPMLNLIQEEYKIGKIYPPRPSKNKKHKDRLDWHIYSNECRSLLPLIIPYLKVKQKQAGLLLEYLKLADHKDKSELYRNKVNDIYLQLRLLNKRGKVIEEVLNVS